MTTREKIISLARECSKPDTVDCYQNDYFTLDLDELEAFYQRVRNETLVDVAKLAVNWGNSRLDNYGGNACRNLAVAIRAMKETK